MVDGPMAGHESNRDNKRRQSQTDGLTRTFRLAVRRRTHAPMGVAASDLDSQPIIRVIPALRYTKRKSGHATRCERPRRGGVGPERIAHGC
jgi:hypothetical protein